MEIGCQGGQGSPRAVASGGWMDYLQLWFLEIFCYYIHIILMAMNQNMKIQVRYRPQTLRLRNFQCRAPKN